ncbi:phage major capsid protein [bacterium]|nr:phage major capsid protein [bacterium]
MMPEPINVQIMRGVEGDLASDQGQENATATLIKRVAGNTQEAFDAFGKAMHDTRTAVEKLEGQNIDAGKIEELNRQLTDLAARAEAGETEAKAGETRMKELDAAIQRLAKAPNHADGPEASATRDEVLADFQLRLQMNKKQVQRFGIELENHRSVKAQHINEDLMKRWECYNEAMEIMMRTNADQLAGALSPEQSRALYEASSPDGGFWLQPTRSAEIVKKIFETSPMREIASVAQISGKSLEIPKYADEYGAGWSGETQPVTATTTGQIGMLEIPVHGAYAYPEVTRDILEDTSFNLEQFVTDEAGMRLSRLEASAFITGDGNLKPRGILDYTIGATESWSGDYTIKSVDTGANGAAVYTNGATGTKGLVAMQAGLKEAYHPGASWLMKRATIAIINSIQDGDNRYIMLPEVMQSGGFVMNLMGYRVRFADDMPTAATNAYGIAFGDFRMAYQIVDRIGISVEQFREKNPPFIGYYVRKRVGGQVKNPEAFLLGKMAA